MHFKLLDLYRGCSLALLGLNTNHYGFGGRNSLLLVPNNNQLSEPRLPLDPDRLTCWTCCQASLSAEPIIELIMIADSVHLEIIVRNA